METGALTSQPFFQRREGKAAFADLRDREVDLADPRSGRFGLKSSGMPLMVFRPLVVLRMPVLGPFCRREAVEQSPQHLGNGLDPSVVNLHNHRGRKALLIWGALAHLIRFGDHRDPSDSPLIKI